MKSIIRWAGSKRALLPELRKRFPEFTGKYVEPFAGSACLFFDRQPKRALLSDLNAELITAYRMIRAYPQRVLQAFRRFPRGEKAYYRVRAVAPETISDVERAARFIYLNRFCFNGLYRTNMKGEFNVPFGPPSKPLNRFESDVVEAAKALRSVELLSADFSEALDTVEPNDFVYLDPPYVLDERRVFSEYLPGSFARDDLVRLSKHLDQINSRGAIFLLSYTDSPEARTLVARWHHTTVWTRRNIAGFAGARRGDIELLASNRPI